MHVKLFLAGRSAGMTKQMMIKAMKERRDKWGSKYFQHVPSMSHSKVAAAAKVSSHTLLIWTSYRYL